ncbi:MAG: hypothetical protein RL885_05400 [Planctomycetota bacterium]
MSSRRAVGLSGSTGSNTLSSALRETPNAPPIDIGWIFSGRLEEVDLEAARRTAAEVSASLQAWFPMFTWRFRCLDQQELPSGARLQPIELLDSGTHEREIRHWDFVFVITEADLVTHYKPFAYAVSSRSIATAVLSTARIDPFATGHGLEPAERIATMTRRLHTLAIHTFCHLNGLSHSSEEDDYLVDIQGLDDLDRVSRLSEGEQNRLQAVLAEVADLRLEEKRGATRNLWRFYLNAIWIGRSAILRAVMEARPWQFPIRLSRLTTAALSATVILWLTAEAWDLGMSRSPVLVFGLSSAALLLTTGYVVVQQRLIAHRTPRGPSEQQVVTRVAIPLIVLIGMICTYAILFLLTILASQLIFSRELLLGWAPSLGGVLEARHYMAFSGFSAALGILVGSLGASFEDNSTIRHIAYVDEET